MSHCSLAGLHFRIIPAPASVREAGRAGFNALLEFLTGLTSRMSVTAINPALFSGVFDPGLALRSGAGPAERIFLKTFQPRSKLRGIRERCWIKILLYSTLILISLPFSCNTMARLKVGTLPILDSLPLSLARSKPIFTENNLVVETVYFESPSDLRAALMSGKIDAVITDLVGVLLLNDQQERVKVVRVALRTSPSRPMFAIMTAPHHPITTVRGLEKARIAISREASDKYVADKLLSAAGVNRWTETEVSSAQTGLEMLQRGKVTAALLSEPLISVALGFGARAVLDDRRLLLGETVVVFNQHVVNGKPAIIRRFLRAYEQSVRELNVRSHQYRSLVMELVRAPSEVTASLPIPLFPFPGEVPSESDVESANNWLVAKKMLLNPVPYRRVVNAGFLWDPYQFRPAACCGW